MIPNITIGARTISAYMICVLLGVLVAGPVALGMTEEKNRLELTTVLLWSAPGVVVGGRLLYAVTNLSNIANVLRNGGGLLSILPYFGGSVFYGGLFGGIASSALYCKFARIDVARHADCAALFIPLFHCFGRIGCFLTGCCYGAECDVGFVYRYSMIAVANGVRRFPIQLVEAAGNLVLFFILLRIFRNQRSERGGRFSGKLLPLYGVLYSVLRFATEFFRGDEYRGFLFRLSTSQIISVFVFVFSVAALFVRKSFRTKSHGREEYSE